MIKELRDMTVLELIHFCSRKVNYNDCKKGKCPFNYNNHCARIIDFWIMDTHQKIEIPNIKLEE